MRKISIFLITLSLAVSTISANAAPVPKESLPCYATTEQVTVAENLIGGILDEVKNGLGYADARAKQMSSFSTLGLTDKQADMLTVN